MDIYEKSVVDYFRDQAAAYDDVDNQVYWRLSDELLWDFLQNKVLKNLLPHFKFLDAGGGTARWTIKIVQEYKDSYGCVYDLSTEMLKEAKKKVNHQGLDKRIVLKEGDLNQSLSLSDGEFDLAINFHNVLGFVKNPSSVIAELARVVKKGGYVVSLVPNLYHNLFFNISVGNLKSIKTTMRTLKGKFTENMPHMNMFTPDSIAHIYKDNNLTIELVSGFPILIYPGIQETQLHGSSEFVTGILNDKHNFETISNIEKSLFYNNKDTAARGNQIFIIGKKKN